MDLAAILEEAGARVHHARNLTESLRLAETRAFDAAILDVNLGRSETCAPVAELLQARAVSFVLHSSDMERRGEVVSALCAPLVKKPSAPEDVISALVAALAGR